MSLKKLSKVLYLSIGLLLALCIFALSLSAKRIKPVRIHGQAMLVEETEVDPPKSEEVLKLEKKLNKLTQQFSEKFSENVTTDIELELAQVADIFPYELSEEEQNLPRKQQMQLRDYYNYVRQDLEHISGGKTLRFIQHDLNLDGKRDTALIAVTKTKAEKYFIIMDKEKILYKDKFDKTYIELMNNGKFPLDLNTGKTLKTINSPCIRLRSFDDDQDFVFFDRRNNEWVKIKFDAD